MGTQREYQFATLKEARVKALKLKSGTVFNINRRRDEKGRFLSGWVLIVYTVKNLGTIKRK